jgi:selenocysteine lyase/cysteine desulfurase
MPLCAVLGLPEGAIRMSIGLYNTEEDIDLLCGALGQLSSGSESSAPEAS